MQLGHSTPLGRSGPQRFSSPQGRSALQGHSASTGHILLFYIILVHFYRRIVCNVPLRRSEPLERK